MSTPADPDAIDLERIKVHHALPSTVPNATIDSLIAAVEALRGRVLVETLQATKALERALEQKNRAEAAEARVVELAGALGRIENEEWDDMEPLHEKSARKLAHTVLATIPAEALERTKAVEECVAILRSLVDLSRRENWPTDADFEPAEDALTKLDTPNKEK